MLEGIIGKILSLLGSGLIWVHYVANALMVTVLQLTDNTTNAQAIHMDIYGQK